MNQYGQSVNGNNNNNHNINSDSLLLSQQPFHSLKGIVLYCHTCYYSDDNHPNWMTDVKYTNPSFIRAMNAKENVDFLKVHSKTHVLHCDMSFNTNVSSVDDDFQDYNEDSVKMFFKYIMKEIIGNEGIHPFNNLQSELNKHDVDEKTFSFETQIDNDSFSSDAFSSSSDGYSAIKSSEISYFVNVGQDINTLLNKGLLFPILSQDTFVNTINELTKTMSCFNNYSFVGEKYGSVAKKQVIYYELIGFLSVKDYEMKMVEESKTRMLYNYLDASMKGEWKSCGWLTFINSSFNMFFGSVDQNESTQCFTQKFRFYDDNRSKKSSKSSLKANRDGNLFYEPYEVDLQSMNSHIVDICLKNTYFTRLPMNAWIRSSLLNPNDFSDTTSPTFGINFLSTRMYDDSGIIGRGATGVVIASKFVSESIISFGHVLANNTISSSSSRNNRMGKVRSGKVNDDANKRRADKSKVVIPNFDNISMMFSIDKLISIMRNIVSITDRFLSKVNRNISSSQDEFVKKINQQVASTYSKMISNAPITSVIISVQRYNIYNESKDNLLECSIDFNNFVDNNTTKAKIRLLELLRSNFERDIVSQQSPFTSNSNNNNGFNPSTQSLSVTKSSNILNDIIQNIRYTTSNYGSHFATVVSILSQLINNAEYIANNDISLRCSFSSRLSVAEKISKYNLLARDVWIPNFLYMTSRIPDFVTKYYDVIESPIVLPNKNNDTLYEIMHASRFNVRDLTMSATGVLPSLADYIPSISRMDSSVYFRVNSLSLANVEEIQVCLQTDNLRSNYNSDGILCAITLPLPSNIAESVRNVIRIAKKYPVITQNNGERDSISPRFISPCLSMSYFSGYSTFISPLCSKGNLEKCGFSNIVRSYEMMKSYINSGTVAFNQVKSIEEFMSIANQHERQMNCQNLFHTLNAIKSISESASYAAYYGLSINDIKLDNVVVDESNVAYVIDWGSTIPYGVFAKHKITKDYTPMSLAGASSIDCSKDMFSLSICMNRLVTSPFSAIQSNNLLASLYGCKLNKGINNDALKKYQNILLSNSGMTMDDVIIHSSFIQVTDELVSHNDIPILPYMARWVIQVVFILESYIKNSFNDDVIRKYAEYGNGISEYINIMKDCSEKFMCYDDAFKSVYSKISDINERNNVIRTYGACHKMRFVNEVINFVIMIVDDHQRKLFDAIYP